MKNELIQIGGKSYKECEVVRISSGKMTLPGIWEGRISGHLFYDESYKDKGRGFQLDPVDDSMLPQNLYILSNEEIKEGDQVYRSDLNIIFKACVITKGYVGMPMSIGAEGVMVKYCKKIIATTDSSLNLPRLSNEFLNAYCEQQGKINKVLVEYEDKSDYDGDEFYGMFSGSDWQMKVSPDNTVTIKRVAQKTYTQEEVIAIINNLRLDESGVMASISETAHNKRFNQDLDKLINSL